MYAGVCPSVHAKYQWGRKVTYAFTKTTQRLLRCPSLLCVLTMSMQCSNIHVPDPCAPANHMTWQESTIPLAHRSQLHLPYKTAFQRRGRRCLGQSLSQILDSVVIVSE